MNTSGGRKMSPCIKTFSFPMKIEEITGQRILTSVREIDHSTATELFVRNLPNDATEDELVPFFEEVGPLHSLRIMTLDKKNENRGYGYMIYMNDQDAKRAISFLNGRKIRNKIISIELSMNNCRIFIGGIPVTKTKDQVWQEMIRQKVENIIDVIMYRSYNNRAENRGFVFVEFPSHKLAARMRCRHKDLHLWGNKVIVDWSVPQPEISEEIMSKVKIIYMRNLSVTQSREELKTVISHYIDLEDIDKIYKFKNYAFIHVTSRNRAAVLLKDLKEHFENTNVEVMFAKPPSHLTQPEFRRHQMTKTPPVKDRKSLLDCSLSPIPQSSTSVTNEMATSEYCRKLFVEPVFTHSAATENWVNNSPFVHSNVLPGEYRPKMVPEALPHLYAIYPNYYDLNLLRSQQIVNQRFGNVFPPPLNYFPGSYRLATQFSRTSLTDDERRTCDRSRNNSVVSDLTECCPSDVLKDYHEMLDNAFGAKDK